MVIKDGEKVVDSFTMPATVDGFTIRTITWPVAGIAAEGPHPLTPRRPTRRATAANRRNSCW